MRLMSQRVINEEVARAVQKNVPQLLKVMSRVAPAFYVDKLYGGIGRELSNGKISYRMSASPTSEAASGVASS